jgi:hypothetical protein
MYTNDPEVIALARKVYPDYTGKKFQVEVKEIINVRSYWEGGSRSFFRFIKLADPNQCINVPAQSAFDTPIIDGDKVPLVPGLACVEHAIFLGKDCGITIHVHPANAPKRLAAPTEALSEDEKTVLVYTVSTKSSYGGISNFRFHEAHRNTGITLERWEAAKAQLIAKKLLNKAGAVTLDGRNIVTTIRGY